MQTSLGIFVASLALASAGYLNSYSPYYGYGAAYGYGQGSYLDYHHYTPSTSYTSVKQVHPSPVVVHKPVATSYASTYKIAHKPVVVYKPAPIIVKTPYYKDITPLIYKTPEYYDDHYDYGYSSYSGWPYTYGHYY